MAKNTTRTVTARAKNPLTAMMKKYRLSTRGATVEAWSGKSGRHGRFNNCVHDAQCTMHKSRVAGTSRSLASAICCLDRA